MNKFVYENLDKLSEIFPPKIYEKLVKYRNKNIIDEFNEILEIAFESNKELLSKIKEIEYLENRKVLTFDSAKELFLKYLKVDENILNEFLELIPLYYDLIEELAQNIRDEDELIELIKTMQGNIVYKDNIGYLLNEISSFYYFKLKNPKKALNIELIALDIAKNIFDSENEHLSTSYNNLALIYQDLGELEKALEFQLKNVEISKSIYDRATYSLITSYNNLSLTYQELNDLDKALEFQLEALKLKENILDSNNDDLEYIYNNLSHIYFDLNEYEKALDYILKAFKIAENSHNSNYDRILNYKNGLSIIKDKIKNTQKEEK